MSAAENPLPGLRIHRVRDEAVLLDSDLAALYPEYFTRRGVEYSPCRADFVGVSRDEVAPPFPDRSGQAGRTDISFKILLMTVKHPGYGVQTKVFNQALKRNAHRFPADFVFQLTAAVAAAIVALGARTLRVVAAAQPQMGNVCACSLAERIIRSFRPKVMTLLGICAGGDESSQRELDLVVADEVVLHDSGKLIVKNGVITLLPDPKSIPIRSRIRSAIQDARVSHQILPALSREFGKSLQSPIVLHPGPVASGNAVVAAREVTNDIRDRFRKLRGIEMESYGFAYACEHTAGPIPEWIVAKAICDFANSTKDDAHQVRAALVSVRFFEELIAVMSSAPHSFFD